MTQSVKGLNWTEQLQGATLWWTTHSKLVCSSLIHNIKPQVKTFRSGISTVNLGQNWVKRVRIRTRRRESRKEEGTKIIRIRRRGTRSGSKTSTRRGRIRRKTQKRGTGRTKRQGYKWKGEREIIKNRAEKNKNKNKNDTNRPISDTWLLVLVPCKFISLCNNSHPPHPLPKIVCADFSVINTFLLLMTALFSCSSLTWTIHSVVVPMVVMMMMMMLTVYRARIYPCRNSILVVLERPQSSS